MTLRFIFQDKLKFCKKCLAIRKNVRLPSDPFQLFSLLSAIIFLFTTVCINTLAKQLSKQQTLQKITFVLVYRLLRALAIRLQNLKC